VIFTRRLTVAAVCDRRTALIERRYKTGAPEENQFLNRSASFEAG